jgi:WD40 repeat protein
VELYDLSSGSNLPKKISGYIHDVDNLIFTPDNKGFYSRDNAGTSIKYCDLNKVTEVITSKEKISGISLSPDGSQIAGAGNSGSLYLWDTKTYIAKTLYKNSNSVGFSSVAIAPDGKRIVVGDVNGQVKLLSIDKPESPRVLAGHVSTIEEIVFNHTGSFMATASNDKTVRLWNLEKLREQPIVLKDHADWVRTAVFTADDEQLLAGINSNTEHAQETIHAWPTKIATMGSLLCPYVSRNLNDDEWAIYVDETVTKESTCENISEEKKKEAK